MASGLDVIVACTVGYLVLMLGVGVWAARRTHDARDFFIAGQRAGLFATGVGTMSAAFSGFVFLGGPGLFGRIGFASVWIVLPVGFTAGLLCWVLGRRLRLLAGRRQVFTVVDAIAERYAGRGPRALAAGAVALGTVAYLAAQLLALGVVLQAILGFERLSVAVVVGLGVLLGYSVAGGMIAGVATDVVQGVFMLVAASAIFWRVLQVTGGWVAMTDAIAGSPAFGAAFLEPFGHASALTVYGFFFVFGVGVLGQPQMLHRFFMIDDVARLRWLPAILGGSQALCLLVWLGVGLAVPALVATGRLAPLARADDAAPTFLLEFAPDLVAGLAFAGILAAIMSTSDSFLNIGSAALVRDLPRAFGRPLADELFWGRAMVVVVGAVAAGLALAWGDLVALLGTFAFGTFAAGLAPALAIGWCWRGATALGASASIATGVVLNVTLEVLERPPLAAGAVPSATALAASIVVLVLVSLFDRAESVRLPADLDALIEDS